MFIIGSSIMNSSITPMEIIVVWRNLRTQSSIPGRDTHIRYRCRWISLFISGIVGIFVLDDSTDETRCTLLLRLRIAIAYRRISSHRDTLSNPLGEYPCHDRLIDITALFSFDDRCEYECLIGFFGIKTLVFGTNFSIKFTQHYSDSIIHRSILFETIGIWIEISLDTRSKSEIRIVMLICRKIESSCLEKITNRTNSFCCKICIDIVGVPSWEDRDRLIDIEWRTHGFREKICNRRRSSCLICTSINNEIFWCKKPNPETISP